MKRTYQPRKIKTLRKFGFRARNSDSAGKRVLKRKRDKGRKEMSKTEEFKLLRKTPKDKKR